MVNVKPLLEAAKPALDYLKKIAKEYGEQTIHLTSSLKKHAFYNLLINIILYLCVT